MLRPSETPEPKPIDPALQRPEPGDKRISARFLGDLYDDALDRSAFRIDGQEVGIFVVATLDEELTAGGIATASVQNWNVDSLAWTDGGYKIQVREVHQWIVPSGMFVSCLQHGQSGQYIAIAAEC